MQQPITSAIGSGRPNINVPDGAPRSQRRTRSVQSNDDEDIGFTVSEGDDDDDNNSDSSTNSNAIFFSDQDEDANEDVNIININDFELNEDFTLAFDEAEFNDFDDLDDSLIEQEEERAIQADFRKKDGPVPGPVRTPRRPDVSDDDDEEEENLKSHIETPTQRARAPSDSGNESHEDGEDLEAVESSSDAFSEGSSWGNDLFDGLGPLQRQKKQKPANSFYDEHDSEGDDSYLWQYFFSSGEGNSDSDSDTFAAAQHEDQSTDEDVPTRREGQARAPTAVYVPSGDSTDEDDGVPPERKRRRAKGTKALEVLGANSYSTRPPLLGSWEIDSGKNVGIIDGRTTRTLSPPQDGYELDDTLFELPEHIDVKDFDNLDELTEFLEPDNHGLELADFINTDNMTSDSGSEYPHDTDRHPAISPYLYRGRLQARVPSASQAMRNRGSPFVNNLAYPTDDLSPALKRGRRRPRAAPVAPFSPMKRRKRRSFRGADLEPDEPDDQDFIGELIEIGAISPIFDVNT